jgi:hypothetical protein
MQGLIPIPQGSTLEPFIPLSPVLIEVSAAAAVHLGETTEAKVLEEIDINRLLNSYGNVNKQLGPGEAYPYGGNELKNFAKGLGLKLTGSSKAKLIESILAKKGYQVQK